MAKIARVVSSEIGATVQTKRHGFPLRAKLLCVIVLALAPLFAVVLVEASSVQNQNLLVFAFAATIFGLVIGYAAGDSLFVEPIRALLRWLSGSREAGSNQVTLFPTLHADEIGRLGREASALNARIMQNTEKNKDMVDEKSLFLTIAAHQLRTPMTDLSWSIGEILDPSTTEENRRTLLQNLDASLKRTLLVINHILASAKIEEGRFGYVMAMVDIVPAVDGIVEQFKPLAENKGVKLVFEHDRVPAVYADSERISLAIFELISNAIDYTPQGGSVTVGLKANNDRVDVWVADTGIGITENELGLIFTKFHRGDNARHVRPNGSGLGLYLVKNIVGSHGSEIRVESDESIGGTKFSFSLATEAPAR